MTNHPRRARKLEWTITALVNGRDISWTYDRATDASRAWKTLSTTGRTHDTGDVFGRAMIKRPDGSKTSIPGATL